MTAPMSLIISAFAPVTNVSKTLTPQLRFNQHGTVLILIDLGASKNRLGGSVLAQVYKQLGDRCPDLDDPNLLKAFFEAIQKLNIQGKILAYHDRADGGLRATVAEMIFAGRLGAELILDDLGELLPALCNEELGAVIQVRTSEAHDVLTVLKQAGLGEVSRVIGRVVARQQ